MKQRLVESVMGVVDQQVIELIVDRIVSCASTRSEGCDVAFEVLGKYSSGLVWAAIRFVCLGYLTKIRIVKEQKVRGT